MAAAAEEREIADAEEQSWARISGGFQAFKVYGVEIACLISFA